MTPYLQIYRRYNHLIGPTQGDRDDEALQKSTSTGQKHAARCLLGALQPPLSAGLCQFARSSCNSPGTLTSAKHFITQTISTQGSCCC